MGVLDFIFGVLVLAVIFITIIGGLGMKYDSTRLKEENEKLKEELEKAKVRKIKRKQKEEK